MRVLARVTSSSGRHSAEVGTDGRRRPLELPPREPLPGSAVSGGELLFLALATCFGNDVHREAAREGLRVDQVDVSVEGSFGGPGEPGRDISYRVRVTSPEDPDRVRALIAHTDAVAEVHATLRGGAEVRVGEVTIDPA